MTSWQDFLASWMRNDTDGMAKAMEAMATIELDDETAERIAVCWLKSVRDDDLAVVSGLTQTPAHPADKDAAHMRIGAVNVILAYVSARETRGDG